MTNESKPIDQGWQKSRIEIREKLNKVQLVARVVTAITTVLESERFCSRIDTSVQQFLRNYQVILRTYVHDQDYSAVNTDELNSLELFLKKIVSFGEHGNKQFPQPPQFIEKEIKRRLQSAAKLPTTRSNKDEAQMQRRTQLVSLEKQERDVVAAQCVVDAIQVLEPMVNNEEVLGKFESYILQQLFEYLEELRELQQENNYSDVLFIFDEIPQVVAYVQAILQGNEVSVPDCLAQKGDAHLTREGIPYLVSARLAAYKRSLELYLKRIELETAPHEAKAKVSTMLKACERMLTEENWNSQHRFDTIKDYIRALEIHIDILNTTRVYEWEPGQIEQLFLRLNTKVARIFTGIRSRWSQKK